MELNLFNTDKLNEHCPGT